MDRNAESTQHVARGMETQRTPRAPRLAEVRGSGEGNLTQRAQRSAEGRRDERDRPLRGDAGCRILDAGFAWSNVWGKS